MPVTHDGPMHFNQMQAFWRGLSAGAIYPRWDDMTHSGYGAPLFIFYPPGIYYLTSAIYFFLRDWGGVMVALPLITSLVSGLAFYWYARGSLSAEAAMPAMAIYIIAPYRLINLYQRGAIAEQLSFIFIPLTLLFAEKLLSSNHVSKRRRNSYTAGLAVVFGAFLLSHPPTAYQFLLILCLSSIVIMPVLRANPFAHLRTNAAGVGLLGISAVLGFMLSSVYLLPAILEQRFIFYEDIELSWPYHSSYVFDSAQTVYDHKPGGFIARVDRIWLVSFMTLAGLASLMFFIRKYVSGSLRNHAYWWLAGGSIAVFMMTRYSAPFGRLIPKIEIGVYSWRMLGIVTLSVSLLAGVCLQMILNGSVRQGRILGALFTITIVGVTAYTAYSQVIGPMYRAQAFKPVPAHFNYATLPRDVPREIPIIEKVTLGEQTGLVSIEKWDPEWRKFSVTLDRPGQAEIRTSNFPGWTAAIDGLKADIKTGQTGNILIDLPAGTHSVTLSFRSTKARTIAGWISAIALLSIIALLVLPVRK